VFISHSSADAAIAEAVLDGLQAMGHRVFLDRDPRAGFRAGEEWQQRLYQELRAADAVVCLVTAAYAASDWCNFEIGVAEMVGARLLPIRVTPGAVSRPLHDQHFVDYGGGAGWREQIAAALSEIDAGGAGSWDDSRSPFPGLAPFDTALAGVFCGREAEVRELLGRLRSLGDRAGGGLLVVTGPSGCGKSSLVRAGLAAKVQRDGSWRVAPPFVPGADPVEALADALAAAGGTAGLAWTAEDVGRRLTADTGLSTVVTELLAAGPGAARHRLLLVIDQAEELFAAANRAGLDRLAALLGPCRAGPARVVLTVRSEFCDQLLATPGLAGVPVDLVPLRPLTAAALRLVIEEPARRAGLAVSRALVDRLVEDTGDGDALPLLAFTLHELADGLRRGDALSADRYLTVGGVQGALARHANAALGAAAAASGLSTSDVLAALARLASVDGSGRRTHRRLDLAALSAPVRSAVDVFVDRRLLTTTAAGGRGQVGVVHEALLTAWPPLDGVLTGREAALRAIRSVEEAAADWSASGRPDHHLWEHNRLRATRDAIGPPDGTRPAADGMADLSPPALAFLDAAQARVRAARARAQARRRRAFAALVVLLVGALTLAVFANAQRGTARAQQHLAEEQQRIAAGRSLLSQAESLRGSRAGLSLRLGVAAMRVTPSAEARASLITTLVGNHYAGPVTGRGLGEVQGLSFSPDRRTMAAGHTEGTSLWDVSDRARPRLLSTLPRAAAGTFTVAFSARGHLLATGSASPAAVLWDVTDPTRPHRLAILPNGDDSWVSSVAFSPDARTLIAGNWDNTGAWTDKAILWDVSDPTRPRRRATLVDSTAGHHAGPLRTVAIARDGRTAATGNDDGTVGLWDISDLDRPHRVAWLTWHHNSIWAVCFSPDGRTLVTGSADQTAVVWDVSNRSGPVRLSSLTGHTAGVRALAYSPDGRTIATGSWDTTAILWDVGSTGTLSRPVRLDTLGGHRDPIVAVAFNPDGHTVVTAGSDRTAVLWDVSRRAEPTRQATLPGNTEAPAVAVSRDGRLAVSGSSDHTILWDVASPTQPRRLATLGTRRGVATGTAAVALSQDGRLLATAGPPGSTSLWDVSEPAHPRPLSTLASPNSGGLASVSVNPDGRTVATGGKDGRSTLWDITDPVRPRRLAELAGHAGWVRAVPFSPDGHILVSASDDATAVVWDVTDRAYPFLLTSVTDHSSVYAGTFSHDGRLLALAEEGRKTILWEMSEPARPRLLTTMTGQASSVYAVGLSADDRLAATGGYDKTAILWDITNPGRPIKLLALPSTSHVVGSTAFSRGGHTLAVGADNTVLWDIARVAEITAHPVDVACAILGTGLTPAEWAAYAPDTAYQQTCPG
jgi:WD40 repeat protein